MINESTIDTFVPDNWDDYIGQTETKERLSKYINASLATVTPFQHTLLTGPPGCGKTTLAGIIANELGDEFLDLTMPVSTTALENVVASFQGVLFLDEIHRASKAQQEDLLTLLQFGKMTAKAGFEIKAGWLTIIGATTKPTKLDDAILDRFQFKPKFADYSNEEMAEIIKNMIGRVTDVEINLDEDQILQLANAANGKPRACRELVLAARAVAVGQNPEGLWVKAILHQAGVDEDGLDGYALDYLKMLKRFGGVAGLAKLAGALNLTPGHIEDIEKGLFRQNFIDHSDRGRRLTVEGHRKITTGNKEYTRKNPDE